MHTPRSSTPAVVLCGGEGARIREKTEYVPRPMVEIGRQPIPWDRMKIYGHFRLERSVLGLGCKGWAIKEYFPRVNGSESEFTIDLDHRGARPDYVLIRPWSIRDGVRRQMADIGAWGGRFVTAIPVVVVHDPR